MLIATGAKLEPYRIVAPLGAGGMGEVFRARDDRLGREVAVKVLPLPFVADTDRLRRFGDEARAAAALSHPGILAVYDLGEHDGARYIVSELLEGQTVRERLVAGQLPPRKAIDAGEVERDGKAWVYAVEVVSSELYLVEGLR